VVDNIHDERETKNSSIGETCRPKWDMKTIENVGVDTSDVNDSKST
jgi:hypothetical protein